MPRDAPVILQTLVDLYRKSAAGSRGATRDFIYDYEQLLRNAGCDDGDEREKAEDDLRRAELESGKLLSLDRAFRSGLFLRVRLSKNGGESWLFQRMGEASPSDRRSAMAMFFKSMSLRSVPEPWLEKWRTWCALLENKVHAGENVQSFKSDDPVGNEEFLRILLGVIHWQGESLIRFASSVICSDSKQLERIEGRLLSALRAIQEKEDYTLEDRGILKKPRELMFHGPLVLRLGGNVVDFACLPGPTRISESSIIGADEVITHAALCLTVENEEVFLELAKRNQGWLLIRTSFPGSAVRHLFGMLREDLECYHFGDSDPAGFDILRDLRQKTGRHFRAVCMDFRVEPRALPLTVEERRTIERLLSMTSMTDVHPELRKMSVAGNKGAFEQESVSMEDVAACVGALASASKSIDAD